MQGQSGIACYRMHARLSHECSGAHMCNPDPVLGSSSSEQPLSHVHIHRNIHRATFSLNSTARHLNPDAVLQVLHCVRGGRTAVACC